MNPTARLHRAGQSLWLDNITRDLLSSGTLERYVRELSVTGLTSNPTIYDKAIGGSAAYDEAVRAASADGKSGEAIFFELALEDLRRAADIFRPTWDRSNGVDGYVSLEVSPLLAYDAATKPARRPGSTRSAAAEPLHQGPRHSEGLQAIEDSIFAGVRST